MKRLAASIEIAGRDLGFEGVDRKGAVLGTLGAYREAMHDFAEQRDLDVWYARLPAKALRERLKASADKGAGREVERQVRRALRRDHLRAFDRLLREVDGEVRFVSEPPLLVPVEELLDGEQRERYVEVVHSFLAQCRQSLPPHPRALVERYRFMHIARKVVGVGSVGTRAWVVLLIGRDMSDPLVLQLKEAKRSVLEPYTAPTIYESQGRRCLRGSAVHAGCERSLAPVVPPAVVGRAGARLLRPPALGREVIDRRRAAQPGGAAGVRGGLRVDPRPRSRAVGRPDRDRRLPGR